MIGRRTLAALTAAALVAALALTPASSGAQTTTSQHLTGTTSDGSQWIADVPSPWNGTVLLYSHGFGPLVAADAPDPTTQQYLLQEGYALVGSSYDPNGSWWALDTAVGDQFAALSALETQLPAAPRHVIAFGTSMGGLISALEAEQPRTPIDGSLTTCGIVAGGVQLNNYQLDGEYAIDQLLNPKPGSVELVNFGENPIAGLDTGYAFDALAKTAQDSAPLPGHTISPGVARLALAMSLMNVADWPPGQAMPSPFNFAAQEQGQYDIEFQPAGGPSPIQTTMDFVEFGRPYIEQADGGNASWDKNVNFARLVFESSYAPEIDHSLPRGGAQPVERSGEPDPERGHHRDAERGLLARAYVGADRPPQGPRARPEDDLRPARAGATGELLPANRRPRRRRWPAPPGVRPASAPLQLPAVRAGRRRTRGAASSRHRAWGSVATPQALEASATSLADHDPSLLPPAFIPYEPAPLSGNNGPFDPFTGGSLPVPLVGT